MFSSLVQQVRGISQTSNRTNSRLWLDPTGTGKSVLLREIIRFVQDSGKNIGITASTGIAAVNIGGSTLHSWAGIGLGEQDPTRYIGKFLGSQQFHNIRTRWRQVDTLLIDEGKQTLLSSVIPIQFEKFL